MYISEEQIALEKIDADFKNLVKEADDFAKRIHDSIKDWQWLEYLEQLEKVKSSTYKTKGLNIEKGIVTNCSSTCETVFVPEGVTEIDEEAFKINPSRFAKVVFPHGLKRIANNAFDGSDSVFELCVKDQELCYPEEAISLVENGDEINQYSLGFSQLPNTLEEIGDYAFRFVGKNSYRFHKKEFEYLILPKSLKKVGKGAFMDCGIKAIYWCGPEYVSEGCFSSSKRHLKKVILGDNVKVIDKMAFDGCGALEELVFSKNLKEIGWSAFGGCASIKNISLPNSLKNICGYAFCDCRNLNCVAIPDSVSELGHTAFAECTKLKEVTLSKNLKAIEDYTFAHCISIENIVLPEGIKKIGKGAFSDCGRLSEIIIPDSVTEISENAFSKCKSLEKIMLGKGISSIPECCFSNCESLKEVIIPDNVTKIANNAFKNCGDFTIFSTAGSYAEQYAKENNIKFQSI